MGGVCGAGVGEDATTSMSEIEGMCESSGKFSKLGSNFGFVMEYDTPPEATLV